MKKKIIKVMMSAITLQTSTLPSVKLNKPKMVVESRTFNPNEIKYFAVCATVLWVEAPKNICRCKKKANVAPKIFVATFAGIGATFAKLTSKKKAITSAAAQITWL